MQNGKCASLSGGVYSDGLSSNTGRADLISANGSSGKGNYAMVKANLLSARWTVVFYCRLTFESNYGTVDPGPFRFGALSLVAWLSLSLCLSLTLVPWLVVRIVTSQWHGPGTPYGAPVNSPNALAPASSTPAIEHGASGAWFSSMSHLSIHYSV